MRASASVGRVHRLSAGLSSAWLLISAPLSVVAQEQAAPVERQATPGAPRSTPAPAAAAEAPLSQAQLEQLVAPIALYPDSLLSQVLMASTYPLEVVQADRWVKAHPDLKGDELAKALEELTWDPSVKSLVNFPTVLATLSEKLDLTVKLGNAFLEQEKELLAAVQALRGKAKEAGNLETTEQQKVIVEQEPSAQQTIIKIEPSNPQVIYVPHYSPTVVFGAWPYPAYPPFAFYPYYSYYPGAYYPGAYAGAAFAGAALSFTAGMALGAAWGYAWGGANWRGGNINVNVKRNANFNRNINRSSFRNYGGAGGRWQHSAGHRRGVSYRNSATAQRFGRGSSPAATRSRQPFRGWTTTGSARGGAAFSGMGSGSQVRRDSTRGSTSRSSAGRAGGMRGGGGRRR
jgi:hypothetical protein